MKCFLLLIPIWCFADTEADLRDYCMRGKFYATELLLKANGSSEFYYYMGKQAAYEEIINYIDED